MFIGGVSPNTVFSSAVCEITNCLVYFNVASTNDNNYGDASACAFDHCCTFPLPAGIGNLTNDPALVNLAGGDYHLQTNSICINSGNTSAVTTSTDADGNPRIVGGTVDIGAYEFPMPASKLSYAWAQQYGLATDGSADNADPDGDGMNNWQEYIAGTNPTNASSFLAMTSVYPVANFHWVIVKWQSVNTRTYCLQRSTNLSSQAFSPVQTNITGQAGTTIFIDATATNGGSYFYRVGVCISQMGP